MKSFLAFVLLVAAAFGQGAVAKGPTVFKGPSVIAPGVTAATSALTDTTASCDAAFVASCTITSSQSAGNCAVVVTESGNSTAQTFTYSDSATNTPSNNDVNGQQGGVNLLNISSAYLTSPITTVTITSTLGASAFFTSRLYTISNCASASWLDQATATSTVGFSTSWPSGTTSATAHQPNIDIACYVSTSSSANSITSMTNGFTVLTAWTGTGGQRYAMCGWVRVTSTGAQSTTATANAADSPTAALASYKGN